MWGLFEYFKENYNLILWIIIIHIIFTYLQSMINRIAIETEARRNLEIIEGSIYRLNEKLESIIRYIERKDSDF